MKLTRVNAVEVVIKFSDDDLINLLSELDRVVQPLNNPPPYIASLRRQLYKEFDGTELLIG